MALTFEGRSLTPEEINAIVNTICDNSEINISCVIDTDKARETFFRQALEEKAEEEERQKPDEGGQFYKGTLRSGQILEAEGNIILLGDVNPGARVVAGGNIIVLGALRGTAIAGLGSRKHAIVVALEMDPIQIRIGDVAVRQTKKGTRKGAQIAYLDLGKIYVAGVYPGFIRTDILRRMTITDKENRLISRLMMPAEKAAKKIVRGIAKRKKRMVMGVDGRSMWFFSRLFPRLTPRIITKVLKISGLDMFSEVFGEETENTAGK